MAWGKFAGFAANMALSAIPGGGIPKQIISSAVAKLGEKDSSNPEKGVEFITSALRQACVAYFPAKTMERFDHIAVRWAAMALQERVPKKEQERQRDPKPQPQRNRNRRMRGRR